MWPSKGETDANSSIFNQPAYLLPVAEAAGLTIRVFTVYKDNQPVLSWPVCEKKKFIWKMAVMPPLTPEIPLIEHKPVSVSEMHERKSALETLLPAVEKFYDKVDLMLPNADMRAFQWGGWEVKPRYTYISQLTDNIQKNWSSNPRRSFRQSQADFTLTECPERLAEIVQLNQDSYKRQGRPAYINTENTVKLVEPLLSAKKVRVFGLNANRESDFSAGVIILFHNKTAYYWIAGSRPGAAMTVLLGKLLPQLFESGIEKFDFVGANTPTIAEFKRRLGASLETYFHVSKTSSILLRLIDAIR